MPDKSVLFLYLVVLVLIVVVVVVRSDNDKLETRLAARILAGYRGTVDHVTEEYFELHSPPGEIDGKPFTDGETVLILGEKNSNGLYVKADGVLNEIVTVPNGQLLYGSGKLFAVVDRDGERTFKDILADINIETTGRVRANVIEDGFGSMSRGVVCARRFEDGVGYLEGGELH